MGIFPAGTVVNYTGSLADYHGPALVLRGGECWCRRCNGRFSYQLAPIRDGEPDREDTISNVRPASVQPLLVKV